MDINWTTFALEIVNFLCLVWLLKRFLYKPILDTLARRRTAVEDVLAQARDTEARAQALQTRYEGRLADWERERVAARERLDAEIAAERSQRLQELAQELSKARARQDAIDAHADQIEHRKLEQQALDQAQRFTRRLLERLASPALEAALVDRLIEDWRGLSQEALAAVHAPSQAQIEGVTLSSAFVLPAAQRQRLTLELRARLGPDTAVRFVEDASLLAGLRIAVGGWRFHLNLADELAAFAAAGHER